MQRIRLFHLFVLFLVMPALALAEEASDSAKDEEKAEWDVSNPPGEWETITIDTEETTWSEVSLSPDGSHFIFDMLGDIYSVSVDGGEATALTNGIEWNMHPKFSPDGQSIAFVSDRGGSDNIWIMDADGSNARAVSEEKDHVVHNPAWSPDGQYLVGRKSFMSTRSIASGALWMYHRSGGNGIEVVERPHGEQSQKSISEPAFSNDAKYLFYSQDNTPGRVWQYNKDSTGQIFVIQRRELKNGKTEVYAGGPGGAIRPTPSPDGKYLAFIRRKPDFTSAIYVKDIDSGNERMVYSGLDRDLQETNGSHGNTPAFAWLPESDGFVFWAGGHFHRVGMDGGDAQQIPVRVKAEKKVLPALRFPVDVAPDKFDVKMIRWAQYTPDRKKVVFQALGHIYVKDLNSGEQKRLTRQDDHFEYYPRVSPDGRQVAYITWDDQELGSIRTVSINGGRSKQITETPGHYVEPEFSSDGKQLVYRKITGGFLLSPKWSAEPGIYIADLKSGKSKKVTASGFNPHFNSAGDRVLFSTNEETKLVLKSVNLDGFDEVTHAKANKGTEIAASPDGRWIAFTEQFNAYVATFPQTGNTVSLGKGGKAIPVRQVSKRAGDFLTWSADSSELSWSQGPTLYSRQLSDAFAFLDGAPEELPEPVSEGLDLGFKADAAKPEGVLALTGGRIVTMRNSDSFEEVIEDGVVIIRDNRIEAVGAASEMAIPEDAIVLDVAGKTVIPGLVDAHAHGSMGSSEIIPEQNWMQFSNLSFGVTTIHDPSNDTTEIFAHAEMQKAGLVHGSRTYSTGTILYGAYVPGFTAAIDNLEDAKFHVQRLKDAGAISVKSYNQPRRSQRQQVIAAATELGIMVVPEGGAKFQHNMNQIVDGHTGIEHAIPIATGYDDVVQLWSQTDVGYTPTFGVAYGGLSGETYWYDRTEVWKNDRLARFVPDYILQPRSIRRSTAPDHHYNHFNVAEFAKVLNEKGVGVQIGAHGQREGLAAHWEFWMMEQGGFTAWEALRGATIDGAKYLGMDKDIGSIEAGKLADLVVIDGNPLDNIRESENVTYTILNGIVYDAANMNIVDGASRQAFFFEGDGGETPVLSTLEAMEAKAGRYGWRH